MTDRLRKLFGISKRSSYAYLDNLTGQELDELFYKSCEAAIARVDKILECEGQRGNIEAAVALSLSRAKNKHMQLLLRQGKQQ